MQIKVYVGRPEHCSCESLPIALENKAARNHILSMRTEIYSDLQRWQASYSDVTGHVKYLLDR